MSPRTSPTYHPTIPGNNPWTNHRHRTAVIPFPKPFPIYDYFRVMTLYSKSLTDDIYKHLFFFFGGKIYIIFKIITNY